MGDLPDRSPGRSHRADPSGPAVGRLGRWLALAGTVVAVATGAVTPGRTAPAGAAPTGPEPAAYLLADADTGVVLAAKDARTPMLVASTVKILTALVALEHLPPDATVPVSARAAAQPAMKITMREGDVWPLDDTLRSLLMASANDAAYALAERVGGTVERFARIAQRSAERLGLADVRFADPAGLDDDAAVGGGTRMSARDLAIVARNALAVPFVRQTAALPSHDFTDPAGVARRLPNHNAVLLRSYPGADGLKTGYTRRAGRTLVATATRDGRTMIAVVLGTWDTVGWARHLLDQGFATPVAAQVGPRLPPVRFLSFSDRRAGRQAAGPVTRPGRGADPRAEGSGSGADTRGPAPELPTGSGRPSRSSSPAPGQAATRILSGLAATDTTDTSDTKGAGGVPWVGVLLGALVVPAVTVLVLRRRAVRRARARRARARALAEARRRRMLHVIDDGTRPGGAVRVVPARPAAPARRRSVR